MFGKAAWRSEARRGGSASMGLWVHLTQQRLAYATHVRLHVESRPGISQESHLLVLVYCNHRTSASVQMMTDRQRCPHAQ